MGKKKNEVSILRSSAAEYLTFLTATGQSDVNAIYAHRFYQKITNIYATSIDYDPNVGTISAEIAKQHAEAEFERYRIKQDQIFESDFDRFLLVDEGGVVVE